MLILMTKQKQVDFTERNGSEVFWLDEELRPTSLLNTREAEELRLKQLQIEQEIKQLEQQAQESNIPSYYFVREIPNKPPPPYTPPGQSAAQSDPLPAKREDVESLVTMATHTLCAAWRKGENLAETQPSQQFSARQVGNRVYKKFLFDLVKNLLIDLTSNEDNKKDTPPWELAGCRMRRMVLPKLTEEFVSNFVMRKVRVLFGFESSSIKENLIIQWSRKKRDRVDELLVRESQEEEQEWTDYSAFEVAVKNNIALNMFDSIIGDSVEALASAVEKKLKYSQQTS